MTFLCSFVRITSTVLLVSFLGFTPQIWILPTFLYGRSFVYFTVAFNVLLAGLFISYAQCVTIDPGTVPPKWEPPSERESVEVKRSTGGPRYCFKCQASKPARGASQPLHPYCAQDLTLPFACASAHHCKTCKKCVLRMDHHCNWVGGCIGYWNYPHFLRFLSFVCWSRASPPPSTLSFFLQAVGIQNGLTLELLYSLPSSRHLGHENLGSRSRIGAQLLRACQSDEDLLTNTA